MAKDTPQTAGPIKMETLHTFVLYDDAKACVESIGILASHVDALVTVTARRLDKLTARVEELEYFNTGEPE